MKELSSPERNGDPGSSRTNSHKRDIPARPRVVLADDNSAMRHHVSRILQPHFDAVGSFESGEEVIANWSRTDPDVIVLDISMGTMNGIEVARHLHESNCHSVVVFLTVHEDPDFIAAAFAAGGSAYVTKPRANLDLVQAIRTALDGGTFVSAQ